MRIRIVRRLLLAGALAQLAACSDEPTATRSHPSAAAPALNLAAATPAVAPVVTEIESAPKAKWTVMVYLAADNNLAAAGVADVDEIEAGVAALAQGAAERGEAPGADVQVVVQAEFSKTYLQQAGCQTPACVRMPSWNTVRFAATGRPAPTPNAPREHGPAGPVIDLGARDMTKAEELQEFVRWAKQVRPAEHYMLVLWNHGGGYTGLIADETTAGNRLMTIDQMRQGITNVGNIDVLDFDMCLMAGYETLAKLHGLADYAVFSEATVPGAGNDYSLLLRALGAGIAAKQGRLDPTDAARLTADAFHVSYDGSRETTTVSAYDLRGFADFESKLDALADGLRERLGDERRGPDVAAAIHDAIASSQRFDYAMLHDVGDALDSLAPRAAKLEDEQLAKLIDDVRGAAASESFRLRSHARSGTDARALKVDRATGLDILWPSGDDADAIRDSGPSSLAAYEEMLPDKAWTRFLRTWLSSSKSTTAYDQEDMPLQAFLLWDPEANSNGADVDLWVLEPDGNLYIPYLGRVTPNGQLTADSWDSGDPFEGYATFRYVTRGTYYLLANLAQDKNDTRPLYDLAYRHGTEEEFKLLYDEPLRLSLLRSYANDSTLTFDKVVAGSYTDLQLVAEWTPGGAEARDGTRTIVAGSLARVAHARGQHGTERMPRVTARQLASARRMVSLRRSMSPRRATSPMLTNPALRELALPWTSAKP